MANDVYGLRHAEPVAVNWLSARAAHEAGLPELGGLPIAALYPRQTSSSATTQPPTSTLDRPFFPTPTAPPDDGNDPDGETPGSLAKSVLEYAILAVGLLVIGCFVLHRLSRLRRANQPPSAFFSLSSFRSHDRYHPSQRPRYPRTHGLPRVDLTYPLPTHTLPVRSTDVDPFGRRLGVGDFNDKDQLPPYEPAGGPPKYFELHPTGTRHTRGTSVGGEHPASPGDPGPGSSDGHGGHVSNDDERRAQSRPSDLDDHQAPQIRSSPPGLDSPSDHPQSNSINTNTENVGRNELQLRNEHVD